MGPSTSPEAVILQPRAYAKVVLHALKYPSRAVFGALLGPARVGGREDGDARPGQPGSSGDGSDSKPGTSSAESGAPVVAEDAWALFHSPALAASAPMLELALLQVDELCLQQGLAVIGWYYAGEQGLPTDSAAAGMALPNTTSTSTTSSSSKSSSSSKRDDDLKSVPPHDLLKVASSSDVVLTLNPLGLKQALQGCDAETEAPQPLFQVYSSRGTGSWCRVGSLPPSPGEKTWPIQNRTDTQAADQGAPSALSGSLGLALEAVLPYAKQPWQLERGFADFEDHLEDICRDWSNPSILE